MTIEIKQEADGRHWLVVIDGRESIGGFKSKKDAERFIKSKFKSKDDVERFIKWTEEIKKIEWWDDEQDTRMWKILHKAHKAERRWQIHRTISRHLTRNGANVCLLFAVSVVPATQNI
jgi:hypothetical protein